MRSFLCIYVLAVIAMFGACTGEKSSRLPGVAPKVALAEFYRIVKAGEIEKAEALVLEPSEDWCKTDLKRNIEMAAQMMGSGNLVMETLDDKVRGNWAVVITRLEMVKNEETYRRLRDEFMYNRDGQWLAVPEGVRSDPAIKPLLDDDFHKLFEWYRKNQQDLSDQYIKPPAQEQESEKPDDTQEQE
ncbi:hypothetical protein ACFLU6_08615 [Acidobacteriota bacterium]